MEREFECFDCGHKWRVPFGTGRVFTCPKCNSLNIRRTNPGPPKGRKCWRWRWGIKTKQK